MTISLPLNLSAVTVTTDENDLGLVSVSPGGLAVTTGAYNSGGGGSALDPATLGKFLGGLADPSQNNLTTAELDNLHLVKGETLSITYNYVYQDLNKDFYAFSILGSGKNLQVVPLIDNKEIRSQGISALATFTVPYNITATGDYSLLFGNAAAGNNPSTDTLAIRSVTISVPDNLYATTPLGIRLADGSQLLTSGDGSLSNGTVLPNLLSDGATHLLKLNIDISTGLVASGGGNLVASGLGNLISQDCAGLISQDVAGVVSNDGGSLTGKNVVALISQYGGGLLAANGTLVASGGGNLVASGGGNLVASGGGNLVASEGGNVATVGLNLISQDGGGLISQDGGGIILRTNQLKDLNVAASPVVTLKPATPVGGGITIGVVAPGQQNNPQVAALTNFRFVTVWSDSTSGHYIIRGQISGDADGAAAGSFFNVSSDISADQTNPGVAALSGGRFVVGWLGSNADGGSVHTQIFDLNGTKIGTEQRVGAVPFNSATKSNLRIAATADGGYSAIYEASGSGPGTSATLLFDQRFGTDGSPADVVVLGDPSNGGTKTDTAAVARADGSVAVAYREVTANPGLDGNDHDGIFLDIVGQDGLPKLSKVQVNTSTSGTQKMPSIAVLTNGNIVVAWIDNGTPSSAGLATVRAQILNGKGIKVGGEYKIADTIADTDPPALTALKDGSFVVTWNTPVLTDKTIVGSRLNGRVFTADGTGDSPVFTVSNAAAGSATRDSTPATVQLDNGTLAVIDTVTTGANSTIHGSLLDVGATTPVPTTPPIIPAPPPPVVFTPIKIGVEFPVSNAATGNLLALRNGFFASVTATSAGYSQNAVLQIFNPAGFKIGAPVLLGTDTSSPVATVLSDGRIATAFGIGGVIYGVISNPDGTASVPTFTIRSETGRSWFVNSIGALTGNRFALVESSYDGGVGGRQGLVQVLDGQGNTTVATFSAFGDFSGNGANPDIKQLSDGRVAVLGRGSNDSSERAIVFSSDFTSSATEVLYGNTTYGESFGDSSSQIAILDNGNFVALFRPAVRNPAPRTDSTTVGLRGQIFTSAGAPVSGLFTLPGSSSDPNASQRGQTVVAVPGGFIIAFTGFDGPTTGNSGSPIAVELQRYNNDGTLNGNLVVTSIDRGQSTLGDAKLTVLLNSNLVLTFNGSGAASGQIYALGAATIPPVLAPVSLTKAAVDTRVEDAPIVITSGHFVAGDGNVDIVTAGANGSLALQKSNGDGTFTNIGLPIGIGNVTDVKVADVNNDGKSDLVVTTSHSALEVLLGQGDGTFQVSAPISVTAGYGYGPAGAAVTDLNGDGKADIVTANQGGTISVLLGDGTGAFKETVIAAGAGGGPGVLTGDLNGDGRADIVVVSGGSVSVLLQQRDGSYVALPDKAVNTAGRGVLVDLNGDGKLDFVAATGQYGSVSVMLGDGDGTFSDPQTIQTGRLTFAVAVAVGDLNGDGKKDIVVANREAATVTVLLGNGDGTFVAQSPIAVGHGPSALTIVDVNYDGRPDIVVTNGTDGTVTTLLNGTLFPAREIVPAAGAPLAATPPVTDPATGTATRSFVDGYGNTVTDTLDQAGRLLTETVANSLSGIVYATNSLTYMSDGSFLQNVTQVTTNGSLATAIAYGPQGQLIETLKDPSGAITGTATVSYGANGAISRHQTTVGKPGFDDLVFNNGAFVSSTSDNAAGTITSRDSSGNVIASTLDNGDGTSTRYVLNPSPTVAKTITHFAALGGTGSVLSDVINNVDQTSLLYTYNTTTTVKQTTSKYTGTDTSNGAPSGSKVSDVIANKDGTALLYSYNPTSTVKQVATKYAATDPANGAPTGARISDVVANTDGTSLVYAYKPTSTVTQVTTRFSATNPANGAPTGTRLSDVVDNVDGTALVYAYNPTSSVKLTASLYSGIDPTNGAPTGRLVSLVLDYMTDQSSVQTFNTDGTSNTTYYSGPDGTGSVIQNLTRSAMDQAAQISPSSLGVEASAIQFLTGEAAGTVLPHPAAVPTIIGLDASTHALDFSALLASDRVTLAYQSSKAENNAAMPFGYSSGSAVVLPHGPGGTVTDATMLMIKGA